MALVAAPFLVLSQQAKGQSPEDILSALQTREAHFPQQKVFLHIDKEEYLAGETIWFKAYLVNAATHRPDTLSGNLNVKLITATNDIATSMLLRLENGVAHGDIHLPDSTAGGNYEIVAYTDWMLNFDERFFFKKDIYIVNTIEENFIKFSDIIRNRRFNRRLGRQADQMQFAFFPEGGNMLAGIENTVAFKAANSLGAGIDASGTITDDDGNKVLEFSTFHNGMGSFILKPEAGQRYTARITFENGDRKRLRLPKAEKEGIMLSASINSNAISVRMKKNPQTSRWENDLYLLAQMRGSAFHFEHVVFNSDEFHTSISLDDLPSGVCQIMVMTASGQAVAERLIFVNKNDIQGAKVKSVDAQNIDSKNHVTLNLSLDEEAIQGGSFSLVVVDTKESETDYRSSIASELLLFSDIGISLEDPMFYFDHESEHASRALDLLMMTHGWKRFDIQKIINEEYPEIIYGFPRGLTIRGKVMPRSSARKTGEVQVELAIQQGERINTHNTTTNTDGDFVFTGLQYDGHFTARLLVDPSYDHRAMNVELTGRSAQAIEYNTTFYTKPLLVTSRGDDWERVPRPETVLTRRSFITPGKDRTPSLYSQVDQVIYFDDIRDQYTSVIDVLRTRVRGLRIIDGQITLRGVSSVAFTNEPLFIVDDAVVGRGAFLSVNVRQIDRLAVMSGAQTAILGSRGTNGALLIYTLKGDSQWHTSHEYIIQGFHTPSETFESKINTNTHAKHNIDRSLFWNPMIAPDGNNIRFSFPIDEHVRNMRLVLQGIDSEGRITFTDLILNHP